MLLLLSPLLLLQLGIRLLLVMLLRVLLAVVLLLLVLMIRQLLLMMVMLGIWPVLLLRRMRRRRYHAMTLLSMTRGDDGVVISRDEMMEQPRIDHVHPPADADADATISRRGGVGDLLSAIVVGCHIVMFLPTSVKNM